MRVVALNESANLFSQFGHARDTRQCTCSGTAGDAGERFRCSATDSIHQQTVRGGCPGRSPDDSTYRSLAAFQKLQHIHCGRRSPPKGGQYSTPNNR